MYIETKRGGKMKTFLRFLGAFLFMVATLGILTSIAFRIAVVFRPDLGVNWFWALSFLYIPSVIIHKKLGGL